MVTVSTSSESLAVATWGDAGPEASKSDRYLARRLAAAGADYKSVAALTFALAASIGGMLWLLLGIVLEHWVVPGGLPGWFRWAWLAVALSALAAAVVRWVVPLLRYRVNLVYAARAIEADHPELHNDLVNAVLVKAHPDAAAQSVVRTLERRAAKRLSNVPADGVVDRGLALRLALTLAGLVAAACLYELAAPKSLLVSAARLVAPWAALTAPARVSIEPPRLAWRHPGAAAAEGGGQLHPLDAGSGTVTVVRGRQLVVSSRIRGLDRDERAELVVSRVRDNGKVDAAAAPWRVAMTSDAEGRLVAVLPDAARGLEHGLEFTIVAGDATGDRVRVAVVDTPALLVREVRYEYPAYTRRQPETAAWQGDLRGVEGTRATIVAEGNRPLDAAWIDLGCDGKKDVPLRVGQHDLSRATGSFTLRLNADRTGPTASSYRLGFQPQSGGSGREDAVLEKLEHRIEVTADLAPEVAIEEPRAKTLKVPPGAPVAIRVRAVDPDFGIARVLLETRLKGGEIQPEIQIFRGDKTGVLTIDAALVPERQGAGPGSVLEYRAVATDNRPESPNVVRTEWRSLEIDPSAPPPPAPPRREDAKPEQRPQEGQQGQQGKQDGKQQDGKQQDGKQQGQQSGGQQGGQQAGQEGGQQGQQKGGQENTQQENTQPGNKQEGNKQQGGQQGQGAGEKQGAREQRRDGEPQGQQQQEKGSAEGQDSRQPGEQQGANDGGGRPENGQPKGNGEKEQADGRPRSGGGQRRDNGAVAHDGTNDGEALERLLENRRRGVRQEQSQKGPIDVEQTKKGQPDDVKQQQRQDQKGTVGQEQSQEGPVDVKQSLEGELNRVDQQQKQGQFGDVQQKQAQEGPAQVDQSLNAKVDTVKQQQDQDQGQQANVRQEQSQKAPSDVTQSLEADIRSVEQQQQQQQRDEIRQSQRQEGNTDVDHSLKVNAESVKQQQSQAQNDAVRQEESHKDPTSIQEKQNRRVGDAQQQNGPHSEGQSDVTQSQQSQQKQGQSLVSQDQQEQTSQGQTVVDQGQQQQAQQGQSVVSQSQQGQAQQGQGMVGQAQQHQVQSNSPPARKEMEWTEQDLANARNAADLALAHLRDAVNGGRTDVLDALGWTPEQARAFLDRWEKMRRQADTGDAKERSRFERTLQSLGLRPDGVRSSRDVPADAKGGQAEGRRSKPPADYRDQFRAFLQGTSVGGNGE